MSRYKRGWFGEPHRHYLASKGIKTKKYGKRFFQEKDDSISVRRVGRVVRDDEDTDFDDIFEGRDPDAVRQEIAERRSAETQVDKLIREQDAVNRAIEAARNNRVDAALRGIKTGQLGGEALSDQDINALQAAVGESAIKLANSGTDISEDVLEALDSNQRSLVEQAKDRADRRAETPLKRAAREAGFREAERAADLAAEGIREFAEAGPKGVGGVFRGPAEEFADASRDPREFPGPIGQIDELENTPGFNDIDDGGANAAIEDEDGTSFGPGSIDAPRLGAQFDKLGPLGPDGNPAMGGVGNPAIGGGGNPVFQDLDNISNKKNFADKVSDKIDDLHSGRREFSDVDLSAFEEGREAFEEGDREELINAISELQSQEAKIKDRWDMLGQAHMAFKRAENFDSAFEEKDGALDFLFGSKGSRRLAEQSEKLADVRGELVKANNKAFTRRKMLEFDLQRMDSAIPPEREVPEEIKPLSENRGGDFSVGELLRSNPALRET